MTANTSVIWQYAAHTIDQLTSPSCETGVIKRNYLLTKNIEEFSGKKFRRMDQQAEKKRKDETESVLSLGRRTRDEVVK